MHKKVTARTKRRPPSSSVTFFPPRTIFGHGANAVAFYYLASVGSIIRTRLLMGSVHRRLVRVKGMRCGFATVLLPPKKYSYIGVTMLVSRWRNSYSSTLFCSHVIIPMVTPGFLFSFHDFSIVILVFVLILILSIVINYIYY